MNNYTMTRFLLILFLFANQFIKAQQPPHRFYENAKCGYISANEKLLLPPVYDAGSDFKNGLAIVMKKNKRAFINEQGEFVTEFDFDDVGLPNEGLCKVMKNGKYGFIDVSGKISIAFIYTFADDFNNGLARVQINNLFGFINTKGDLVIPAIYQQANNFSEDMASVFDGKKWGFINTTQQTVIPFKYDRAYVFNKSICAVQQENEKLFIDKKGTFVKEQQKSRDEEEWEERAKDKNQKEGYNEK